MAFSRSFSPPQSVGATLFGEAKGDSLKSLPPIKKFTRSGDFIIVAFRSTIEPFVIVAERGPRLGFVGTRRAKGLARLQVKFLS